MRVHHLNCGSMHPYFPRGRSFVYCLPAGTNDGLLLGDYVPRLRELLHDHGDEVSLIGGHDARGFLRHQSRRQGRQANG
ncbi:MAG: hypothetical protein E3J64_07285 [Anaerolineales bacterium]|nr:MAG: hypothetical protein E3J64_07285 [Anaerolineales bacterium]